MRHPRRFLIGQKLNVNHLTSTGTLKAKSHNRLHLLDTKPSSSRDIDGVAWGETIAQASPQAKPIIMMFDVMYCVSFF